MKHIYLVRHIVVVMSIISLLASKRLPAQEKSIELNNLNYVRVYSDSLGESHFEDLTVNLNEIDFAPPAPPIFTSELNPSAQYGFIGVLPGWKSEWHPTPKRQFVFYVSGTIEAEVSDGEIRQFGSGNITLVEDTYGKGHKSRAIGNEKVICVIVQLED